MNQQKDLHNHFQDKSCYCKAMKAVYFEETNSEIQQSLEDMEIEVTEDPEALLQDLREYPEERGGPCICNEMDKSGQHQ